MTTPQYAWKLSLIVGAVLCLSVGRGEATCFGFSITDPLSCGGGPYNFAANGVADVVGGTGCVDTVDLGRCDLYCALGGADITVVKKNESCSYARMEAGAGADEIECRGSCQVGGGDGEDVLTVNGASYVDFNGNDHGDTMIWASVPAGANISFDGGSGTDVLDCNGYDETADSITLATTSVESFLNSTCGGGCCN